MAAEKETKRAKIALVDLLNLEKATRTVCQRYENSLRKYDGSIDESNEEYSRFDHFNKKRLEILDLLEKEIDEWEL